MLVELPFMKVGTKEIDCVLTHIESKSDGVGVLLGRNTYKYYTFLHSAHLLIGIFSVDH